MADKARIYLDACCFIEMADHQIGKHRPEREEDILYLKALLKATFDGEIESYTSILSIAECQFADGANKIFTDDIKDVFKRFLTSGIYIILIQPTILVGERARDLLWIHNISFSGADALHIASALEQGCAEFITFDDFKGKFEQRKAELDPLGLRLTVPRNTWCLPKEYAVNPEPLLKGVDPLPEVDEGQ